MSYAITALGTDTATKNVLSDLYIEFLYGGLFGKVPPTLAFPEALLQEPLWLSV